MTTLENNIILRDGTFKSLEGTARYAFATAIATATPKTTATDHPLLTQPLYR